MRILLVLAGAIVALTLVAPAPAGAGQCGLPDASPLWIDYVDGTAPFRSEFAQPGVVVATQGGTIPQKLRAAGALTVYWEMKLSLDVGTPGNPTAPDGVAAAADALFARAAASSGCVTPVIALNELQGATDGTPLSATEALYRADVLSFLQELAARGAQVYLLMSAPPNPAGGPSYWQQVATYASIVREVYVAAPTIIAQGPDLGSRTLRIAMRRAERALLSAGVPAAKTGLMLGFQSGGAVGRDGLQPSGSWFEFVKLDTLAAEQVAGELGISTLWAWGWGTLSASAADPDKPAAACVELWVRNPALCNAPAFASFDSSLSEGQFSGLPSSAQCTVAGLPISTVEFSQAAQLLGSRAAALTALFERAAATTLVAVNRPEVMQAQAQMFPSLNTFLTETRAAGVTPGFARGVLTDQLRFEQLTPAALLAAEQQQLAVTVCRGDVLPALGDIRLSARLPFLGQVPLAAAAPLSNGPAPPVAVPPPPPAPALTVPAAPPSPTSSAGASGAGSGVAAPSSPYPGP